MPPSYALVQETAEGRCCLMPRRFKRAAPKQRTDLPLAMDPNDWRYRMCWRKKGRYASRGLALEAAERFLPVRLSVYRCDVCQRWHLTSHPSPVRASVAPRDPQIDRWAVPV